MSSARDHIFISYATEDAVLADWLARKLGSLGYAVWYDRFKLLGGEPWPQEIDDAIKTRTFRMLGLLSRASLRKPSPTRERTLAQQLAKDFGESDFLILLNLEGLRPGELTWTLTDTNYIAFADSWAEGLRGVLKKLDALGAPRVLTNGPQLAAATFDHADVVKEEPETLLTNCFPITQVPAVVRCFDTEVGITKEMLPSLQKRWACRQIASNTLAAFEPPPDDVQRELRTALALQSLWSSLDFIKGIDSRNLAVSLIHISLETLMAAKGLLFSVDRWQWYFPGNLVESNRLRLSRPDGTTTWFQPVGERTFRSASRSEVYRYHLSPSFRILRGTSDPFLLLLRNQVFFTTEQGMPLAGRTVNSRRKHLCKNWWNEEWLNRVLAVVQFLAGSTESIRIGHDPDTQLVVSAIPLSAEVPLRIDETKADTPEEAAIVRDDEEDEVDSDGEEEPS